MAMFVPAIVISFFSIPAHASVVNDTSLAAPGVYFGSGNSNVGFTTYTGAGANGVLELGLSAINRYIGPATEVGDQYYVPTGATTVSGKTGSEWGFDFSVNTRADGTGTATLASYSFFLTITDLTAGLSSAPIVIDPTTFIPDNAYYNGSVLQPPPGPLGWNGSAPAINTVWGMQNSEPASLTSLLPTFHYDMNAAHIYEITLSAIPTSGVVVDPSISIFVNAQAPEPATFGLAGVALLGLGVLRRKIKV